MKKTTVMFLTVVLLASLVCSQTTTTTTLPQLGSGEFSAAVKASAVGGHKTTYVVAAGESIQAAIDAASPGDTILVGPGVFNERIVIDKPLKVMGGEDCSTVLDGGDIDEGACVLISSDDVVFSRFSVTNCYTGVIVLDNLDVSVTNLEVFGVQDGFLAFGSNHLTLEGNIFSDNIYAIYLYYAKECVVSKNVVEDSPFGIWLFSSGMNVVEKNVVDTGFHGFGVLLNGGSSWNVVEKNTFLGNYWGVLVEDGRDNEFRKNVLCGNTLDIFDVDAAYNMYSGNCCSLSDPTGLCDFVCE